MAAMVGIWAANPAEWRNDAPGQVRILHAEKEAVFLSRRPHQQRCDCPHLQAFWATPVYPSFTRQQEAFEIQPAIRRSPPLISRRAVHFIIRKAFKVARRGLFDVLHNAIHRPGAFSTLFFLRKFQQVFDALAAFVEIERIGTSGRRRVSPGSLRRCSRRASRDPHPNPVLSPLI
jgi:hypothetical protein